MAATQPRVATRYASSIGFPTFSSYDSKIQSSEPTTFARHSPLLSFQTRAFSSSDSYKLSSFAEPEPTLFVPPAAAEEKDDPDALLRSDIRTMGSLLGKVMEESTLHQVEGMRALAKKWRADKTPEALQALALYAANLDNQDLQRVSRAFTHFMALANAAEQHHRVRRLGSTTASSGLYNKPDSCGGVLPALLKEHEPEEIFEALTSQMTELILTAHPTQGLSKHYRRSCVIHLDVFCRI
jgi:hypothetical protein